MKYVPRSPWFRAALVFPSVVAIVALLWWRGPDWGLVARAFNLVDWAWIVFAIGLNLASVLARSLAWRLTIDQALDPPRPRFDQVFSAFSIGLLANAVLPGRIGELARVAVLRRHLPTVPGRPARSSARSSRTGSSTSFRRSCSSLRLLDGEDPALGGDEPVIVLAVGVLLFTLAFATAKRRHRRPSLEGAGPLRRLLVMARQGLAVLRSPLPAAGAIVLQTAGWVLQLFAVYVSMRAFNIHAPLPAAGLVVLLMNVATIFPLWPGNFGLLQAAVALPLVQYGVSYSTGFAYAIVLQFVEMSVGVGVGLIFLAREGLSFAMLRHMPDASELRDGSRTKTSRGRRRPVRALACPASLKGVLSAASAAAALAAGLRERGAGADEFPVADGGEGPPKLCGSRSAASGTRPRCATPSPARGARAGSPPGRHGRRRGCGRRSSRSASARSARSIQPRLWELVAAVLDDRPTSLLLSLGGTATMDAGEGFLEVVQDLRVPARVACDVTASLAEAPRLFGPQKGAGPEEIADSSAALPRSPRFLPAPAVAPPAGSAPRSPRSARRSFPARRSCSTPSASTPPATTWSSPAKGGSTPPRRSGKRPARSHAARRERAASSSEVWWRPAARGRDDRALGRSGSGAGRPRSSWDET